MLKNLLNIATTVISDTVTSDGKPGGYVNQDGLNTRGIISIIVCCLLSFVLGIIVEKITRFFKDCKEINKQYNDNENEDEE